MIHSHFLVISQEILRHSFPLTHIKCPKEHVQERGEFLWQSNRPRQGVSRGRKQPLILSSTCPTALVGAAPMLCQCVEVLPLLPCPKRRLQYAHKSASAIPETCVPTNGTRKQAIRSGLEHVWTELITQPSAVKEPNPKDVLFCLSVDHQMIKFISSFPPYGD